MTDLSDGDRFLLEIVPVGENVRTARLFGASIARHFRCDEEQVEDLKLALSEAVSRVLRSVPEGDAAGIIRVAATKAGPGLTFSIEGPAAPDAPSEDGVASSEELILALFPDARFADALSSTEFTVALP